jgi:peptidoglycan/xylan/chitin deacetylase (PgdA/CDA1 family)
VPAERDITVPNPKPAPVKLALQALRRTQAWHSRRGSGGALWTSGARILCYHRVARDRGDLAVSPRDFRRQIELLLAFDARVVRLAELPRLLAEQPGERFVCLTFDDGYRDFEDEALPVLREAGVPATLFVTTGFASGTTRMSWYKEPRPLLGWADLERLATEELVELGAHTRTHPDLRLLSGEEAREEIEGCRAELEERLGVRPASFAYPAGLFSDRERRLVEAAGYALAVTVEPGVNDRETSPYLLRRTLVEGLDGVSLFEAKLAGRLDTPWEIGRFLRSRLGRA